MATSAVRHVLVDPHPKPSLSGNLAALAAAVPDCDPSAFTREADGLYVSTRIGLSGAKGALLAIGLEAAAALCLFAAWQLWRIFR
jgi:hypothetical protein